MFFNTSLKHIFSASGSETGSGQMQFLLLSLLATHFHAPPYHTSLTVLSGVSSRENLPEVGKNKMFKMSSCLLS